MTSAEVLLSSSTDHLKITRMRCSKMRTAQSLTALLDKVMSRNQ